MIAGAIGFLGSLGVPASVVVSGAVPGAVLYGPRWPVPPATRMSAFTHPHCSLLRSPPYGVAWREPLAHPEIVGRDDASQATQLPNRGIFGGVCGLQIVSHKTRLPIEIHASRPVPPIRFKPRTAIRVIHPRKPLVGQARPPRAAQTTRTRLRSWEDCNPYGIDPRRAAARRTIVHLTRKFINSIRYGDG